MRLSIGSAGALGLSNIKQDTEPTTCYILLGDRCDNSCAFCSQVLSASMLSRIEWPEYDHKIIEKINSSEFKRVCLQCTSVTIQGVAEFMQKLEKPVSVSYNFRNMDEVRKIKGRICIPLDVANRELYSKFKHGSFDEKINLIADAAKLYPGRITTHVIAGLGETLEEMFEVLRYLVSIGVSVGTFAFTPVAGTDLENIPPPSIEYYRKIQAQHYRLLHRTHSVEPDAFQTKGCENCNRPYYNERPCGPIYNYPRELTKEEYDEALALAKR